MNIKNPDITGNKYGRLTALKRVEDAILPCGHHATQWLCQCDCGNTKIVQRSNLTSGSITSCGCLRKEKLRQKRFIPNRYILNGDYGIGYTDNNKMFYFDLEDYNKIKNYHWQISQAGYVIASIGKGKIVRMHRIIMNPKENEAVDHIGGKTTKNDNRKYNLRIVSYSQNNYNRPISKNNTSGVKGVWWDKNEKKWRAKIQANKKIYNLGSYHSKDIAICIRRLYERSLHKNFTYEESQNMYLSLKSM